MRIWASEAKLVSLKRFLVASRVVWAYHYLRHRAATLRVIAAKLGYAEYRDLARHVRRAAGVLPRELTRVDEDELLRLLQDYLVTGGDRADAQEARGRVAVDP